MAFACFAGCASFAQSVCTISGVERECVPTIPVRVEFVVFTGACEGSLNTTYANKSQETLEAAEARLREYIRVTARDALIAYRSAQGFPLCSPVPDTLLEGAPFGHREYSYSLLQETLRQGFGCGLYSIQYPNGGPCVQIGATTATPPYSGPSGQLNANRNYECPKGFQLDTSGDKPPQDRMCYRPLLPRSCEIPQSGNPISAIGNKIEPNVDLAGAGNVLTINRYYQTDNLITKTNETPRRWIWSYQQHLTLLKLSATNPNEVTDISYVSGHSSRLYFKKSGSSWIAKNSETYRLTATANGWDLRDGSDTTERFDLDGKLVQVIDRSGRTVTVAYNAQGEVSTVTDAFGRVWTYTYQTGQSTAYPLVASISDPQGNQVQYSYSPNTDLLTNVTFPDGSVQSFTYTVDDLSAIPLLKTKIDASGRVATFEYDANGFAISTQYLDGVNKYQLNYVSPYAQTIVTDPLGTQRTYNFQTILGVVKTTGVSQPCPSCGGTQSQATTYDANGNVASRTDFNNKKSCYSYDLSRNLETARVEGVASAANCATELAKSVTAFTAADQKKIETLWHATYRLPTKITEPAAALIVGGTPGTKVTDFTYDANGNMLTRKVTAPKNDGSGTTEIRTWTYTYNALGQVLTAKDALNRTTTTTYYAATDTAIPPKYTMGDVQTITNAANHVVTMNEYDKNGRLLKMTDANGLVTTMTYHPRGWMTSRAVSNGTNTETTFYVYDNVGQLTRVVLPDQSNLFYAYDDAHRLVGMSDQLVGASPVPNGALIVKQVNLSGNKLTYTLDNMGNRIKEQHYDPSGVLQKQRQRAIDALNRLKQDIGGSSYASAAPAGAPVLDASVSGAPANASISQYGYDNNGNVTSTTDPLGRITQNQYDALNRLTQVIDPQNGATKPTIYTYDASNNLTQVTDPQGLQTKYTYNGHGNLIKQESPDTGTTQTKVNAMGNVTAKIDSMNRCTTTAYDVLHRPTSIRFYASSNTATNTQALCFGTIAGTVTPEETHTYTYDSITATLGGPGGKGRISRIADAAGRVDYVYDQFGRITSKTQVTTGATNPNRVVTYQYSANGQLRSMTYPSGQTIAYTYGSPGSINPGKSSASC